MQRGTDRQTDRQTHTDFRTGGFSTSLDAFPNGGVLGVFDGFGTYAGTELEQYGTAPIFTFKNVQNIRIGIPKYPTISYVWNVSV